MSILVNAHTHLYSGLAPFGMPAPEPEPRDFLQILEGIWWRLDRALDAESLRAGARHYVARALVAGTGALIDHHESPHMIEGSLDVLADVCEEFAMPALLCYGATERNGGREEARAGLAECRRFIVERATERVKGLVGLHASFTVSDETIREAAQLARELDTALHVHVAEDASDVRDARDRGYDGVIDRLGRLGALVPGSILAHGVQLSSQEVEECRDAGCWLVQNPRSNQNNRVGFQSVLSASTDVALGTDGFPSDMLLETERLVKIGSEHNLDASVARERLRAGERLAAVWWSAE
ncbi:MAG: amidohydrolase family protein, partial [Planctomycetes bacterium]|nr:amidohydrolase family protein [Planctomycetota bacterium]